MRVPLQWLREYCDPPLQSAELAERLTLTGTKVEAIHRHGAPENDFYSVGIVLTVEPHPDADRLKVCSVDLGQRRPEGPAQIVCGAANVRPGQVVAVAEPGAKLPDGSRLKAAKLRGVRSEGMLLAEDELQVGVEHAGIMVLGERSLDRALTPGMALEQALAVGTDVLELEITPNRPDCLSIYGIARELHAATGAALAAEPWREDPGSSGPLAGAEVQVLCPQLCPRFTARLFHGVRVGPSPLWLKARLMAAGQRPINNVVDITNYVMLLTGQPSHAFDFDRLAGGRLTVRKAMTGEQITTLDGQVRQLDEQTVLIADDEGPTAIAGLMGGERSEVHAGTKSVLLEVANWNGPNIHRSALALGMRSEASARFEKGLAPQACEHAQALAGSLMIELCGAQLAPGTIDLQVPGLLDPPVAIALRFAKVQSVLGMQVPRVRQAEILQALDFGVQVVDGVDETAGSQGRVGQAEGQLLVTVPPWRRGDVSREADLIEEIARIAGLEQLPVSLPARRGAQGLLSPAQRLARGVCDLLVAQGLHEVKGWTFASRELLHELRMVDEQPSGREQTALVALRNPLSAEQELLRPSLLCSLRTIAAYNAARDGDDFGIFEVGTVFSRNPADGAVRERRMLGIMLVGADRPVGWRATERDARSAQADFFSLKAILEAIGGWLGVALECRRPDDDAAASEGVRPYLHPGKCAEIHAVAPEPDLAGAGTGAGAGAGTGAGAGAGGESQASLGWIGELHPLVAAGPLANAPALEIDLRQLLQLAAARSYRYEAIHDQPALLRDYSLQMPVDLPFGKLQVAMLSAQGRRNNLIEDIQLSDVYEGASLKQGQRAVTLRISFRAEDRTLSDEDIAPLVQDMLKRVADLGVRLRGTHGAEVDG